MYRLFNKQPFKGAKVSSRFMQAKYKYLESLLTITEHYQHNSMYINNRHILIRLISGFMFDPYMHRSDLYRKISYDVTRICSGYGITTDTNAGIIFKKSFYTFNTAIISTSFSNAIILPSWKQIRAVRVLTHPHTTLNLVLPHRLNSVEDYDYAVVGIDVPLLAVQYQQWFLEEIKKPVVERETIMHFVYKWVLPGMLPEQIDISLRNRIRYKAMGITREEQQIKPPIFVQTYDNEFDNAIDELIKYYNTGKRTLSEVLVGMPMFHADNYFDAVPKGLEGISLMSYWTKLLIYTDWLYPVALGFNIDPQQELVSRKLRVVKRTLASTLTDKFINDEMKEDWEMKYNFIMEKWCY